MSLCSSQDYRKECLGSYPLLLNLCPEHWYAFRIAFLQCMQVILIPLIFSKRRNKCLTSVTKTLWGEVFVHLMDNFTHYQILLKWAETPSIWKCYKTNLSLDAGARFHRALRLEQQSESCFHFTDQIISSINTSNITALSPGGLPLIHRLKVSQGHIPRITIIISVWVKNPEHYLI